MKRLLLLLITLSMLVCVAFLFSSCTDGPVEKQSVTVYFNTRGGNVVEGETQAKIDKGASLRDDLFPEVERNGYELSCWAYDMNGENVWYSSDNFLEDTTLYAIWEKSDDVAPESSTPDSSKPDEEKEMIKITFSAKNDEGDGEILVLAELEIEKGTRLSKDMLPLIMCEGYDFVCWAYDFNGDEVWNATDIFTSDTTLYAILTPAKEMVTITFNLRGGDLVDGYGAIQIEKGTGINVNMFPEVEREGYRLVCWAYDREGKNPWEESDIFNESTTLYAVWEGEPITITFDPLGGNVISGDVQIEIPKFNKFDESQFPVVKKPGYVLLYWAYDKDGVEKWNGSLIYHEDTVIYAIWQESVTIIFNTGMGYFENSEDYEAVIPKGNRLEKLPTPVADDRSWVFAGWYKDEACTELASLSNKYSQDTTLYAGWEKNEPCTDDTYGHLFGSWEEEKRADCTNAGVYARYCLYCQYKQTKISEPAKGHQVTSWQDHFMTKVGVCTRIGCNEIIKVSYNNVTSDVLGNDAEAQIEGNNDKFFSPSFINLVNGKWDDGAGEYVSPRGNGAAYVQFNLISATSLDRIYFKGESLTSIIVYVQYEGDEEFTLAGICGSTTDIDNIPYVEADSTKKIVSVRFVEENPSIGGAKWQEIAFTKALEEVIEDSNTGGAGGENETGGVSLWNIN